MLAHEVGHYFGLLHTFEGGCSPPDGVLDTPANLDPDSGWQRSWLAELTNWCKAFRQGKGPDPKALLKYKSCPNRGGKDVVDNVFNMMSYLDDVCRMAWTENQVRVGEGGGKVWGRVLTHGGARQRRPNKLRQESGVGGKVGVRREGKRGCGDSCRRAATAWRAS